MPRDAEHLYSRCPAHWLPWCFSFHAASVLGLVAVAATSKIEPVDMDAAATAAGGEAAQEVPPPLPRKNAVLVFGGTGKLGRRIVEKVRQVFVLCFVQLQLPDSLR